MVHSQMVGAQEKLPSPLPPAVMEVYQFCAIVSAFRYERLERVADLAERLLEQGDYVGVNLHIPLCLSTILHFGSMRHDQALAIDIEHHEKEFRNVFKGTESDAKLMVQRLRDLYDDARFAYERPAPHDGTTVN